MPSSTNWPITCDADRDNLGKAIFDRVAKLLASCGSQPLLNPIDGRDDTQRRVDRTELELQIPVGEAIQRVQT